MIFYTRLKIIVGISVLVEDGPKSYPEEHTADLALFPPIWMDGGMISIIGFKLTTKGKNIRSTLNGKWNMILDGESYMAESHAGKSFCKRVEEILRAGAGWSSFECKMLT